MSESQYALPEISQCHPLVKGFQSIGGIFQKYLGRQTIVGLSGKESLDYHGPAEATQMLT
jgi:hypothetical protein